ncbi:MAG: hypothetical protein ACJAVI_003413 [Candidatus Azotimanducaceae bacterium]|jgi:hypothetical protein
MPTVMVNFRSIRKIIINTFLVALLTLTPLVGNAQDRPNILLLMAEDLSPRIGAFDDTLAIPPNIDQLANEGVRYTKVFTAAGVCAPSRAALIMAQEICPPNCPANAYMVSP